MNKRTELIISDTLKELGISPALRGYTFLRSAIGITLDNPDTVHRVTRGLYPKIAEMHNTTPTQVERTIRCAIEAAWPMYYSSIWEKVFKRTIREAKGKPTNSMFIATVADYLSLTRSDIHGS